MNLTLPLFEYDILKMINQFADSDFVHRNPPDLTLPIAFMGN